MNLFRSDKTSGVNSTQSFFKMEKIYITDSIKILNNPDILNYRACRVVFYLTIYETDSQGHKDRFSPHMHKLALTKIRLVSGDILFILMNDSKVTAWLWRQNPV